MLEKDLPEDLENQLEDVTLHEEGLLSNDACDKRLAEEDIV